MTAIYQAPYIGDVVTVRDIAERLGVSQSSVFLALKEGQRSRFVAEATRQRIQTAAAEMGYRPNQVARAVATGRTKVIGFIGGTLGIEYVGAMVSGVLDAAQEQGFLVKIFHTSSRMTIAAALDAVIGQRLAGVICMNFDEAALFQAHQKLARCSIPLLILGHTGLNMGTRRAPGIRIGADEDSGMEAAVGHLVGLGHSKIALVSESGANTGWLARTQGYRAAMRKRRLACRVLPLCGGNVSAQGCEGLLLAANRPTAVICVTDYHAVNLLRLARRLGLRVPEDLSVVGHSDLVVARYADPPLTTITTEEPWTRIGEIAGQQLLAAILDKAQSPASPRDRTILPMRLSVRDSTGPAPGITRG
ncbi:MAG: LacI family DNA-binding transcriptional regulator [Kiritimatiellae bacterium]|nr:LacI family DNA-binding transcriptional regulator [Kiritimatiellia bacterium]